MTLLGSEDKSARNTSTKSVEAHNAYLQGHFYFERRNLEDYRKAVGFFDQAIRLDPDYALAYAERSEAWTWIGDLSNEKQKEAWATRGAMPRKPSRSTRISPKRTPPWAGFAFLSSGNLPKVSPNSGARSSSHRRTRRPTICWREWSFISANRRGRKAGAAGSGTRPSCYFGAEQPGPGPFRSGKTGGGGRNCAQSGGVAAECCCQSPLAGAGRRPRGDSETALREAQLEPDEGYRRFELAIAHYASGDRAAADAALADLIANGRDQLAYQIAEVYAWRGETDKAFEWLQIAFDNHDTGLLSLLIDPLMRSLRDDTRYKPMLAKVGLPLSL